MTRGGNNLITETPGEPILNKGPVFDDGEEVTQRGGKSRKIPKGGGRRPEKQGGSGDVDLGPSDLVDIEPAENEEEGEKEELKKITLDISDIQNAVQEAKGNTGLEGRFQRRVGRGMKHPRYQEFMEMDDLELDEKLPADDEDLIDTIYFLREIPRDYHQFLLADFEDIPTEELVFWNAYFKQKQSNAGVDSKIEIGYSEEEARNVAQYAKERFIKLLGDGLKPSEAQVKAFEYATDRAFSEYRKRLKEVEEEKRKKEEAVEISSQPTVSEERDEMRDDSFMAQLGRSGALQRFFENQKGTDEKKEDPAPATEASIIHETVLPPVFESIVREPSSPGERQLLSQEEIDLAFGRRREKLDTLSDEDLIAKWIEIDENSLSNVIKNIYAEEFIKKGLMDQDGQWTEKARELIRKYYDDRETTEEDVADSDESKPVESVIGRHPGSLSRDEIERIIGRPVDDLTVLQGRDLEKVLEFITDRREEQQIVSEELTDFDRLRKFILSLEVPSHRNFLDFVIEKIVEDGYLEILNDNMEEFINNYVFSSDEGSPRELVQRKIDMAVTVLERKKKIAELSQESPQAPVSRPLEKIEISDAYEVGNFVEVEVEEIQEHRKDKTKKVGIARTPDGLIIKIIMSEDAKISAGDKVKIVLDKINERKNPKNKGKISRSFEASLAGDVQPVDLETLARKDIWEAIKKLRGGK